MIERIVCRDKPCHECGFIIGSDKGTLKKPLLDYLKNGIIFPCHLELEKVTGSENTGIEEYIEAVDKIKICRGLVMSMYKSNLKPKNVIIEKLYSIVKDDDMSNVMTIEETIKHHLGDINDM
jgi:hypothetical protein